MSDPVISFQNSGLPAQTLSTATVVSLPDAPSEMLQLPAGSVLPAVIVPPEALSEPSSLQMILPDGKQLDVPVKLVHTLSVPTPVSIKILPFDAKKPFAIRIHFSAPLPDVKKAIKEMPEALRSKAPVFEPVRNRSFPVRAFVLHSVPEQISALMNEMEAPAGQNPPLLKPNQTIRLELSPQSEQTSNLPTVQTAEIPPMPETEQTAFPNAAQTPADISRPVLQTAGIPLPESSDTLPAPAEQPPTVAPTVKESTAPLEQTPDLPTVQTAGTPPMPETVSTPVIPQQKTETEALQIQAPTDVQATATPSASEPVVIQDNIPASTENVFIRPKAEQTSSVPSDAPENQKRNLTAPASFKGIVFDFKERSAPLVVTKIGVLALEEKIRLPHLTPVTVRITEISEPTSFLPAEHSGFPDFQGIEETLNLLQKTDTAVFESFKNVLPQTGNKLPAQIASFIRAISQNAPAPAFIGEANVAAIQSLGEKGHGLLTEIEKEIKASPKKVSDGRSPWKGWTIPFLSGAIVEPVSLYLQRPQEDGHRKAGTTLKQNAVRFVLDLNLTRLGKLQMDGLAHRNERRFDLIVRHQNNLPVSFDDKIRFIFTQTLTALNYTGTVNVEHTDQFIVLTEQIDVKTKQGVWA